MSLQARLSQDDHRLYSANRDVAHCFPSIATLVACRLEDQRWPALSAYLKANNVSDDDLALACQAFVKFVQGSCDNPEEKMVDVLTRSGFLKLNDAATVAYMAVLGQLMTGVFFRGVREAHVKGFQSPLATLSELQASAEHAAKLLSIPRWKRPLLRWAAALRGVQHALKPGK